QAVEVLAVYNDPAGTTQQRLVWNSDPASPTFKNDAQNETLSFNFGVPAGATSVSFKFNYVNAANDWWWAVDNLEVTNLSAGGASVWAENFDGVALQDSVNERRSTVPSKLTAVESAPNSSSRPDSFTNVPPTDWAIDNSGLPAGTVGRDDKGVYEWEGWNFATLDFWKFADTQGREQFTKCTGNCAIADSDEWTDLGGPGGPMDTLLTSPTLDITGVDAGKLRVAFDSSWRQEDDQVAQVEVSYDGGAWEKILRYESHQTVDDGMGGTMPNPNFHPDATNESVLLALANPGGAHTAQLRFSYLGGNNNWWWAVDNVKVSAVPEPSTCGLMLLAAASVAAAGRTRRQG
ncbi:MAG: PEP-CTERM sorting domain-containing protein, partial [Pirellulales bacterium]